MAPIRKHTAPVNVPRFTSVKLIGCPVNGRIKAAIAEIPKAIDPRRFKNAICHERFPIFQENKEWPISIHARPLAIKKQTDPYTSGTQTCWFIC